MRNDEDVVHGKKPQNVKYILFDGEWQQHSRFLTVMTLLVATDGNRKMAGGSRLVQCQANLQFADDHRCRVSFQCLQTFRWKT